MEREGGWDLEEGYRTRDYIDMIKEKISMEYPYYLPQISFELFQDILDITK